MQDQINAAIARLDEDLELLEAVPVANTQAARTAAQATRLAAHERFAKTVREAVAS